MRRGQLGRERSNDRPNGSCRSRSTGIAGRVSARQERLRYAAALTEHSRQEEILHPRHRGPRPDELEAHSAHRRRPGPHRSHAVRAGDLLRRPVVSGGDRLRRCQVPGHRQRRNDVRVQLSARQAAGDDRRRRERSRMVHHGGSHTLVVREAYMALPEERPYAVGAQVHGGDDDVTVCPQRHRHARPGRHHCRTAARGRPYRHRQRSRPCGTGHPQLPARPRTAGQGASRPPQGPVAVGQDPAATPGA